MAVHVAMACVPTAAAGLAKASSLTAVRRPSTSRTISFRHGSRFPASDRWPHFFRPNSLPVSASTNSKTSLYHDKRKCAAPQSHITRAMEKMQVRGRSQQLSSSREEDVSSLFSRSTREKFSFPSSSFSTEQVVKALVIAGFLLQSIAQPALAEAELAAVTPAGGFDSGFASSFLLIFFSEIGDKTFFIAALLAARGSGLAVFAGTYGALVAMTVISVALGQTFHIVDELLPASVGGRSIPWDDVAAALLLVYFGVSTLRDAAAMESSKAEEEQQEAERAVANVQASGSGAAALAGTAAATFALVFVAEWGDKSFFSTIALAAASSPVGVIAGAAGGHGLATVLAVLGGSFLSSFVSEKVIAYIGGTLFLFFAAITLVDIAS